MLLCDVVCVFDDFEGVFYGIDDGIVGCLDLDFVFGFGDVVIEVLVIFIVF